MTQSKICWIWEPSFPRSCLSWFCGRGSPSPSFFSKYSKKTFGPLAGSLFARLMAWCL